MLECIMMQLLRFIFAPLWAGHVLVRPYFFREGVPYWFALCYLPGLVVGIILAVDKHAGRDAALCVAMAEWVLCWAIGLRTSASQEPERIRAMQDEE